MYNTSNEFKEKIKEASRSFECKITIGDRIFTNEDIVDIKFDGNIQPQDVFMIGTTTSQTLDLTLVNKGETIYSINQIKVEIGLKIGNTIEYIPMGLYNIDDVVKTDYTIKFTAFDNMIKFERAYFSSLGNTPTLQQVVTELASKTGVQFIGTLPNYNVKKLEGYTCREILSYIASLCGGNAVITRDGRFTIVVPKEVAYTLNGDNYFDYKREEVKYKIGQVTCKVEDKNLTKGSLGTDSIELLFENPWVTDTILTDIYNKVKGFEFLGYTMKWQGDLSLDVGDIITCTDTKGVVRKIPILSNKLTYTGGLTSEISAKGESKNKNSFSSSGSNSKKLDRVVTELALVNKAFIDYANINNADITNLKAETAKIKTLEVETANINNLLAGNVTAGSTQTINLTSKNVVIEDAVIKELIASRIRVADLIAGNIDTNRFNIVGSNGNLLIKDNTIQIKDSTRVRVQIGKDASNDYSMYVWDASGKLMFDATGLKADGIKNKIIRDDMISDNANINGKKIDISSLVTEVNKDTNTQLIKASKVAIDLEGQKLDVAFSALKSNVDNIKIGGRNLLRFTDFSKRDSKWWYPRGSNYTLSLLENDYKGTYSSLVITGSGAGAVGNDVCAVITEKKISTTDKYLFSTMIYSDVECIFEIRFGYTNADSTNRVNLVVGWNRVEMPIHTKGIDTTKESYGIYFFTNKPSVIRISMPKLEIGTKFTDWTPAPEDIGEVTNNLQTQISANNGSISTLIKDTTIEKDGKTVKLKDDYSLFKQTQDSFNLNITSQQSDMSETLTDTASKVSGIVGTIDSITTRVENTESTINTIDGNISSINTKVEQVEQRTTSTEIINTIKNSQTNGEATFAQTLEVKKLVDKVTFDFSHSGGYNLVRNSGFTHDFSFWSVKESPNTTVRIEKGIDNAWYMPQDKNALFIIGRAAGASNIVASWNIPCSPGTKYTFSFKYTLSKVGSQGYEIRYHDKDGNIIRYSGMRYLKDAPLTNKIDGWGIASETFTTNSTEVFISIAFIIKNAEGPDTYLLVTDVLINVGTVAMAWIPNSNEIQDGNTIINANGVTITNGALTVKNKDNQTVITADENGNLLIKNLLTVGGNNDGTIQVKNSAGTTIFLANKNGTFVKDGTMQITNGEIINEGIGGYPSGEKYTNTVKASGNELHLFITNASSQFTTYKGNYLVNKLQLIEDNRQNAEGNIITATMTARKLSIEDIELLGGYSKGSNGYTKLPNGFILQWGYGNFDISENGTVINKVVTLPVVFPNMCVTQGMVVREVISATGGTYKASAFNCAPFGVTSQITLYANTFGKISISDRQARVNWWALGY